MLGVTGAADTVSTVLRQTIRQLVTPDYLRGRTTSINMVFFMGGPQLGELEAGAVAANRGLTFRCHGRRRFGAGGANCVTYGAQFARLRQRLIARENLVNQMQ